MRLFLVNRLRQWFLLGSTMTLLSTGINTWVFAQIPAGSTRLSPATGTNSSATGAQLFPPFRTLLKSGNRGAEVSELQATLKLLGYFDGAVDGVYGQSTVTAVSLFQKAAGLNVDGIAGPATWNRLFPPSSAIPGASGAIVPGTSASTFPVPSSGNPIPPAASTPTPRPTQSSGDTKQPVQGTEPVSLPILRVGMKGPAVNALQERLRSLGVFRGAIDGVFGQETQAAVKAAQRKFNLDSDGVVGPATWNVLLR